MTFNKSARARRHRVHGHGHTVTGHVRRTGKAHAVLRNRACNWTPAVYPRPRRQRHDFGHARLLNVESVSTAELDGRGKAGMLRSRPRAVVPNAAMSEWAAAAGSRRSSCQM